LKLGGLKNFERKTHLKQDNQHMAITNSKGGLLAIVAVAGIAAFFVLRQFFPQIIEQIAVGIVAFFVFLGGLIFRRKKG